MYSETKTNTRAKYPRATHVHVWATVHSVPLRRLWREVFPRGELSYSYFVNVINGHRHSDRVADAVAKRLEADTAKSVGIPPALVRQFLFPER